MNRVLVTGMMIFLLAGPARAESGKLRLNRGEVETASLANLKTSRPAAFAAGKNIVIQLDGPMTKDRREALRAAGVVLHEYLPDFSYVADVRTALPARVADLDFVSWIGEFQNDWKLDPELGRRNFTTAERQNLAASGLSAVIVTLFEGHGSGQVAAAIAALPNSQIHYIQDEGGVIVVSATVRTADVAGLANLVDAHYIEEAPEITMRNATSTWIVQSNVSGSTPVWAHGITGAGQIVGHMDGAINMNHCAFFDPVNNTPSPTHRKVVAYNEALSYNQHGTHTADTSAGEDYQGSTGNLRGMAYGGKIAHSPIPSFSDTGFYNAADLQFTQGARAFTNSWGNDGTTSYDGLCRGVDRFSYDREDALVMFAVTNTSALKNPENAKNLVAVGACQDTPNQANFCSGGAGPTVDGRRKPEVYAPGCSTSSASGSGSVCTTANLTGTSMASPVITGMALLARQYYMQGWYPSGAANAGDAFTPSGALLKATILNATVDMTGISGYPSNQEGWGRLLLDNTLYFSGDARRLLVPADIRNASGLSTGQQTNYNFNVLSTSQQLKITLVWTEPPASASTGSGNPVINDLDLEVVNPSSTLYLGNVFSGGVSVTGGARDAKNNVEMVILNSPPAGSWTVRVKGTAINSGTQGYAVVISGDVSGILPPPAPTSIDPNNGDSGASVAVTVNGSNFQTSGTTLVRLERVGYPAILAGGVSVSSSSLITCTFDLATAEGGSWDVVVVNPDLQVGTLTNGFTVNLVCTPADVNLDGQVDGNDIARFTTMYLNQDAIPVERCAGDLDALHDGVIDDGDVDPFVNCLLNGGC